MKFKLIYLFTIAVIVFGACKEDPEQVLPDFPWDCDYDIGTYEILPSSYAAIPYEGKQKVVFMDSLGNEVIFHITTAEKNHVKSKLILYGPQNPNVDVNYCYYGDAKDYMADNESLQLKITLSLYASPFSGAPLNGFIADELQVTVKKVYNNAIYGTIGIFYTTFNQRTFPFKFIYFIEDNYECFGKSFLQVNSLKTLGSKYNIYFNLTEGVVSFQDETGKRWRFERFE